MTAQPNILLITADQQRFDTVPPDSPAFLRTPHLEHLQAEGTTFSRAYTDNPICAPSRTAIMTGRTVAEHGMLHNGWTSEHIDRRRSLPAQLREAGYATAAIGKMHFHPLRARHGFDEMLLPDDYYTWIKEVAGPLRPMSHGLGQNELYPTLATVPEGLTLTSWIAEQSLRFLRDRRDPTVPFFLWTSFTKPHPPLDPPEPYYSLYRDAPIPAPVRGAWVGAADEPETLRRHREREVPGRLGPEIVTAARAAYYGLVTQVDYSIGRLLSALQDTGELERTLIVFTSDHGELLGDHGLVHKTLFLEPAARVPLILRPPPVWDPPPGASTDVPVLLGDLLPTLLAAADARPAEPGATRNVLPLALGEDAGAFAGRRIEGMSSGFGGDPGRPEWFGITDGRHKYVWYPEGPAEQLFDLHEDPRELVNLAGDPASAAVRDELRAALVAGHRERGSRYLVDGDLPRRPRQHEPATARAARRWAGYHSEAFGEDLKH